MHLLIPIMRTQGYDRDIDFKVVDFVNHAILLVDAARPRLFKYEVFQVLHLPSSCSRMLLQFQQHIGNFLDSGFVATLLDGGKFYFRLFGKKNDVSHMLQRINHRHDIVFALQPRKLGLRLMRLADVLFYGLHVAAVSKERVTRWANLIRVGIACRFKQFACQPVAVAPRKRETLYVSPKFVCCYCCHKNII